MDFLLDSYLDQGAELLLASDEAGLDVRAAFWRRDPESGRWELFLALGEPRGIEADVVRLLQVLRSTPERWSSLETLDVDVIDPEAPLVRRYRRRLGVLAGVQRVSCPQSWDEEGLLPDAIVYRLLPAREGSARDSA